MDRQDITKYLRLLGEELLARGVTGEIVIAGGAFMLLVIQNRDTTKDIDAYFSAEPKAIRDAARVIAEREDLPPDWLNDGIKGFFYEEPSVQAWADFPGLRIYMVTPEYAFALKSIAGRPEDIGDLRALITHMGISTADEARDIVARYVPPRLVPPRTEYLIETLFEDQDEADTHGIP
jgi:predicted nucleotidyltransferase